MESTVSSNENQDNQADRMVLASTRERVLSEAVNQGSRRGLDSHPFERLSGACEEWAGQSESVVAEAKRLSATAAPSEAVYHGFTCPDWVKTAPAEIRCVVEQEYFVNPERARFFFDNAKTYNDIQKLRTAAYLSEETYKESSIAGMELL